MKKTRTLWMLAAGLALLISACQQDDPKQPGDDKRHLSSSLVNNPATGNGFPETAPLADATMDFTDTTFNFGNVSEGEIVTHDFNFKNNGKEPLLISDAHGSCGCTIPEYPHDPIPPGGTGVMKVSFNSKGKKGHNEKSVTINTNSNRGYNSLFITADVN